MVGTGSGTVTSTLAGIDCGATCSAEFEGEVTLTAKAAAGYVFVGWIGCKHTNATTCEVDVTAATEVTAVFRVGDRGGLFVPGGEAGYSEIRHGALLQTAGAVAVRARAAVLAVGVGSG